MRTGAPSGPQIQALASIADAESARPDRRWKNEGLVEMPSTRFGGWLRAALTDAIGGSTAPRLKTPQNVHPSALVRASLLSSLAHLASGNEDVAVDPKSLEQIREALKGVLEGLHQQGIVVHDPSSPVAPEKQLAQLTLSELHDKLSSSSASDALATRLAPAVALLTGLSSSDVPDVEAFSLTKLAELIVNAKSTGRPLSLGSISEGFLQASASIDAKVVQRRTGIELESSEAIIPPRKVFFRSLAPLSDNPSGKVFVLPPGLSEDSDNMLEQAEALRAEGHWVICPDMRFEGFGEGVTSGKFGSLMELSRDILEVAEQEGGRILREELDGHEGAEIVLSGNSTSGAASFLAAQLLSANAVKLGGSRKRALPSGIRVALASPYFGPAKEGVTKLMNAAAHTPLLNFVTKRPLLAGSPMAPLHASDQTLEEMAQLTLTKGHHAAVKTMESFDSGLELIHAFVAAGIFPSEMTAFIDDNDKVADAGALYAIAEAMGPNGYVFSAGSDGSHSLVQDDEGKMHLVRAAHILAKNQVQALRLNEPRGDAAVPTWFTSMVGEATDLADRFERFFGKAENHSGWHLAGAPAPKDDTARFTGLLGDLRSGKSLLHPKASDFRLVLVPGLGTEHYPGYLDESLDQLKNEMGLDVVKLEQVPHGFDTDAPVATNLAALEAVVESSDKPVILIGHSKGGVEVEDFRHLIAQKRPDLEDRLASIASIQGPIGGAAIADAASGCPEMMSSFEALQRAFGGEVAALTDLTTEARKAALTGRNYEGCKTPALAITSFTERPSEFGPLRAWVQHRFGDDVKTDGLVLLDDQKIPGAKNVTLPEMSHGDPAFETLGQTIAPRELIQVVVRMAVEDAVSR